MIEKILISSSELIIKKELGKETSLPLLKKNQVVNAKVLQLLSQGKAALLVNGQKVVAKTAMFLTPGEEVQLKVIQAKDALVLKLLGPVNRMSTNQLSAFASLFSKTGSLSEIAGTKIADLKDLLYDISLKSDKRDDQFLPRLLNSSGISWEKKVASLFRETGFELSKPNLEQLIQQDMKGSALRQLMSGAMGKTDGLNAVSNFSETIENFQLLNHQTAESGRYLLPFPVFAEAGFSFGQMLIDLGQKDKEDKQSDGRVINLSFLLDMTNLGPLRADFSILKKAITGRFLLCDDDIRQFISTMIPQLKERMEKQGYQVHQITCETVEKVDLAVNTLIEETLRMEDDRVLNIVI